MTLIYSIKADRVIEACRFVNTPIAVSALREFSAFALRIANWLVGHISAPLNTNDRGSWPVRRTPLSSVSIS
jgi:hypothetical protein